MVDRALFMETLRAVQEIAKASPEPMGREEIQEFFKNMELSSEQQELIYQYFQKAMEPLPERAGHSANGSEQIAGKTGKSGRPSAETENPESSGGRKTAHSKHYQMYLNEINKISDLSQEGKTELYQSLLDGEQSAVSAISAQWLKRITGIAKSYVTDRALVEDLVQEGNMGLLLGMEQLLGAGEQYRELALHSEAMERQLETYVREAMEEYRREMEGTDNGESAVLAKVNLLYEAQKVLAEENGTIPDIQELSEYTRIPADEVRDILALSQKKGE